MQSRRDLLRATGATLAGASLAGCTGDQTTTGTETPGNFPGVSPAVAVAAEWTAIEARVFDALALAEGGEWTRGAALVEDVFERFEQANGTYGAHAMLEETDAEAYEAFEEALSQLREAGIGAGDRERARREAGLAAEHLATARRKLVGERAAAALSVLALGARVADARWLAAAGKFGGARATASRTYEAFEQAPAHDVLESADSETYETFEGAVEAVEPRADEEDAAGVRGQADSALAAAVTGAYAVAPAAEVAAAGHLAVMQGRGFDASVLATLGGPGGDVAHAAALNGYRARVHDAAWLTAGDAGDHAAAVAKDTFAHFEGARAHEALEEADHEAYEAFEGGLESIGTAASEGDADAVEAAVSRADAALVGGQTSLANAAAPVLESAFFRIRLGDALERYQRGESAVAAGVARSLFERFERDEAGFHEAFEHHDHDAYETFEGHLASLATAFEDGDESAVETHLGGALDGLTGFETGAGSPAVAVCAEASVVAARVFDAHVLATLGDGDRASSVVTTTFERFERGDGGLHEALEHADHETYETFEHDLEAAKAGGFDAATAFYGTAVDAIYAIVGASGGTHGDAAKTLVQDTFGTFEEADVHETLEEADHGAYETFEERLNGLAGAIESGHGVRDAAGAFARAALRAKFAVVGASGDALVGTASEADEERELAGGPNVVDGVPEDADHVVKMQATSYEPAELTVSSGDTVAFEHAAGEPHTVTARGDGLPEGASYWASGGFDGEDAAEDRWEHGEGAVQSGQSYVRTFEATGEHDYYCIPHAGAGMEGTVVVE
jgi:plastocyanin